MYLLASLFGYLTFKVSLLQQFFRFPYSNNFKNVTGPELFVMYSGFMPDDKLILVGRIMVLVCVIFSAPLLHYPCRKGIFLYKNWFLFKMPFSQEYYVQAILILTCILAFIMGVWGEDRMPGKANFSWLIWLGTMVIHIYKWIFHLIMER